MFGSLRQIETNSVDPAHVAVATGAGLLTVGIAAKMATAMAYVGGTFVAAGVFLGPAAPLGGVAGLIIHDLFRGAIGYSTLVVAAWMLVFSGLVVWLTGPVSNTSERLGLQSTRRTVPTDIGMVLIAGIHATAFTAWLAMMLGWQRFYTAAIGLLPGVVVAMGMCVVILVSAGAIRRLGLLADRTTVFDFSPFRPAVSEQDRSAGRTGAVAVGALTIGAAWLGGALALDIFVHDLGLFTTASQFRAYITEFLGTSSPIAVVGTSLLVGVYRYGELAVLLSAPVAMLALWGWNNYRGSIFLSLFERIKRISGGSTQ
ncbi:hypothetical protein [Halorubrum sp. N11]|uniref:hypothetical protein n=1 Tax=Halorubrum sp. N11 TaxID=3402276 RepID=UPI003EC090A1